jgi:DNA-binding NarL/FixJ family response regulator
MPAAGSLSAGQAALDEGRWEDAYRAFEAALADAETADAHLGLAEASWWLCDARASVRHRERAWSLLREAGDVVSAGRVAIDLCIAYLVNLGNEAAAHGWLARAERVLGSIDPNPLQGWLWLMRGYMSVDPEDAHRLLVGALDFARQADDIDLELVAMSDLGLAEVAAGNIEAGMALLDEAMAGTIAGEYERLDTVVFATCSMLAACHRSGDLDRASEWCRAADEFMAVYGCPFLYARCRVHYGGVLVASGLWTQAEQQFQAALDMSADAGLGVRGEAVAELADLRLRQGRIDEAESLLGLIEDTRDITLAAAALRLARGDVDVAAGLLERRARTLGDLHVETPPTLSLLVDAQIASDSIVDARDTAVMLASIAERQGRDAAHAHAAVAAAHVAVAEDRVTDAVASLERALAKFASSNLALDAARVRLDLALLVAGTHKELAVAEAQQALAVFERLGAAADADAATAVLRSLGAPGRTFARTTGMLTERESQVLRLVAAGLSNPEIAERLYISRKTASNHVSSILTKLGLRNRAEAVAFASKAGGGVGVDR